MAEHSRSTADDQRERSRALLAKLKSKRTFRGSTKFNDEEGKEKIGPSFSQIMEEKISSMYKNESIIANFFFNLFYYTVG